MPRVHVWANSERPGARSSNLLWAQELHLSAHTDRFSHCEARSVLKTVAAKVETRAAKQKAEDEAAAEAERLVSEKVGAARKVFRAKVAARPAKMHRVISMAGRVDVF